MVNYQDGKIYKIVDNTNDNVYIGSTCTLLCKRLAQHKENYRQYLKGQFANLSSFQIITNDNYDIVLVEKYPCKDKEELHKRERHYIETTPNCVNKMIPTRTHKEYYQDNREATLERVRKYAEVNKDKIKIKTKAYRKLNDEKIKQYKSKVCICQICNCEYTHAHLKRHERTKKHQYNLLATKQ